MPKQTLSVRDIDKITWHKMRIIALERGCKVSKVLQDAIDDYLKKQEDGK